MPKNRLLIITPNWPAPNYSAAGVRLMQLAEFFKKENYGITIASTADMATINEADFDEIDLASIRLNHPSFDEYVTKLCPDIVLFDRFMTEEQFGWRVAQHLPNTVRILDTQDLHSLRKTRQQALENNNNFSTQLWLQNDMSKREIASIYRSDLSLIISSYEMQLLESIVAGHESILQYLPFMEDHLDSSAAEKMTSFEKRKDFVFIGFGGHAPNLDTIQYLKEGIWPLIRIGLSEANLHVYGGNLPEKVYQLHDPEAGFFIKGWAKNAKQVVGNARVMLAPLRFGAGLKGKLVDAMRCGTPSVTTAIGAEGMHGDLDWGGLICDDPKPFANAAIELYKYKEKWRLCQKNGIEIINTNYDSKALSKVLRAKIFAIQDKLRSHRTNNFIGAMLQHQTMSSTKYMAKWIEGKCSDN